MGFGEGAGGAAAGRPQQPLAVAAAALSRPGRDWLSLELLGDPLFFGPWTPTTWTHRNPFYMCMDPGKVFVLLICSHRGYLKLWLKGQVRLQLQWGRLWLSCWPTRRRTLPRTRTRSRSSTFGTSQNHYFAVGSKEGSFLIYGPLAIQLHPTHRVMLVFAFTFPASCRPIPSSS